MPVAAVLIGQSLGCHGMGRVGNPWLGRGGKACAVDGPCHCKTPPDAENPFGDSAVSSPQRRRKPLFGPWPAQIDLGRMGERPTNDAANADYPPEEVHAPTPADESTGRANVLKQAPTAQPSTSAPERPKTLSPVDSEKLPLPPAPTDEQPDAPVAPPPPAEDPFGAEADAVRRYREGQRPRSADAGETSSSTDERSQSSFRRPVKDNEVEEYPFQPGRGPVSFNDRRDSSRELPQYPHAPGAVETREVREANPVQSNLEPTQYTEQRAAAAPSTDRIQGLFDLPTIQPGVTSRSATTRPLRSKW